MKSVAFFLFLGLVSLIGLNQAAEDYCSESLCKTGLKHIGCQNSGEFKNTCPPEKKLIVITDDLIKLITQLHNTLRNDLAGGKVSSYDGATRMASMVWDPELAKLAEMHVKRCLFEHDECHATTTFKNSGQNLAESWYSGSDPSYAETIEDLIRSWFDEKKDANMEVIRKYPLNWTGEDIGHFTEMVQEGNTHLGCAAVWMIDPESDNMDSVLLTCNYATTNFINEPVYDAGTTASKCKTGTHPTYKNLCSSKETYDV